MVIGEFFYDHFCPSWVRSLVVHVDGPPGAGPPGAGLPGQALLMQALSGVC